MPSRSGRAAASFGIASSAFAAADAGRAALRPREADVAQALERRIAALRERGGDCARYGSVLERSYRLGQLRLRPFMWRVGSDLASGESKPSGEMTLAREIDALNVGVRTLDDVVASIEHEAAHIAFDITRSNGGEERAVATVRECGGAD